MLKVQVAKSSEMLQDSASSGSASKLLFQTISPSTTGAVVITNSWGLTDSAGCPLKTFISSWPMVSLPTGWIVIVWDVTSDPAGMAVGAT